MHILVVEDDPTTARLVAELVQKAGHEPLVVQSVRDALARLRGTPTPALVVADIMLPDLDGLALLQQMGAVPAWAQIPVLMCTALNQPGVVRKAIALGCTAYVLKPIRPEHFLEALEAALISTRTVLGDTRRVTAALGIDLRAYQRMAAALAARITEIAGFSEDGEIPADSKGLFEAALMLREDLERVGAERALGMLDHVLAQRDHAEPGIAVLHERLTNELQALREELLAA